MDNALIQTGLFVVVGAANTAIDFVVYNALTGTPFRWPRVPANIVSTTVAMAFSFTVNFFFVFPPEKFAVFERIARFVAVTACSLYLVQSIVIYIASSVWKSPVAVAVTALKDLPVLRDWSNDVLNRNLVKVLATGFSLTWNFFWYKFFVFA